MKHCGVRLATQILWIVHQLCCLQPLASSGSASHYSAAIRLRGRHGCAAT